MLKAEGLAKRCDPLKVQKQTIRAVFKQGESPNRKCRQTVARLTPFGGRDRTRLANGQALSALRQRVLGRVAAKPKQSSS